MNSPNRLQQIEDLFHAALEREPAERAAFLFEACADDHSLLDAVNDLLNAHDQSWRLMDQRHAALEIVSTSDPTRRHPKPPAPQAVPIPAPNLSGDGQREGRFVTGQMLAGRYRIVSLLGKGGMGEVYKAEDLKLNQTVALKFLPAAVALDGGMLARFHNEVRIARQVAHPNVCRVYDIGEVEGLHFLSMEFIDGEDLSSLLRRIGRLPGDKAVELARQMCAGLAAAHEAGVLHRDLKPANVMIDGRGKARITDFGLAVVSEELRGEEAMAGTPAYMAPEQLTGKEVTQRSDIYALGLVLYELFTGKRVFEARSIQELVELHEKSTPPTPSSHVKDIDPLAEHMILRCLEKDPKARPTATEVDKALQEAVTRNEADTASHTPSIAVLPFANISNDPDNEYFCDGLAEELLNALSKIESLRVAARTSAFSFKGKETEIREIGRKLNVGAVLEGSVRKSGNRLRITAQLINVADGYHLWSERYDRQMEDIFEIQGEISLSIVGALKVKLLGAEKAAVLKRYTDNTEAYQLYLLGRFQYSRFTSEGWRKAIECYWQAIAKDPEYAPAYAGIAYTYVFLYVQGYIPPDEAAPHIKAAAARALALDQTLAESHLGLAGLKLFYEWDWAGAERELKQALSLNPNNADARRLYSILLSITERRAEAMTEAIRALELDPLSLLNNLIVGMIFLSVGEYDLMLTQGRNLIELEPRFFGGYWLIGHEYWTKGRFEQAISEFEKVISLGATPFFTGSVGHLYGLMGERDKAQDALDELLRLSARQYVQQFCIALIYAGLGEMDRAFDWLEQSYEQRDGNLINLKQIATIIQPGLLADPRLTDLARRIGLP
jgi:eukaryotic-like serine/threonine-protein kinase